MIRSLVNYMMEDIEKNLARNYMTQSPMSYFQVKLDELSKILNSADEKNCFAKLVEYFQVCREISKRESAIIGANFGELQAAISLLLANLPYCQLEVDDLKVSNQCEDDEFLGCRVEDQKYIQSFMESSCEYKPMIFTYRDNPTKDSITVYYEGINRTLAYIDDKESNQIVVKTIKEMICNRFFGYQKEVIQDSLTDISSFYIKIACELQTLQTRHVTS